MVLLTIPISSSASAPGANMISFFVDFVGFACLPRQYQYEDLGQKKNRCFVSRRFHGTDATMSFVVERHSDGRHNKLTCLGNLVTTSTKTAIQNLCLP